MWSEQDATTERDQQTFLGLRHQFSASSKNDCLKQRLHQKIIRASHVHGHQNGGEVCCDRMELKAMTSHADL